MEQIKKEQAADIVLSALSAMSVEEKPDLVSLLQSSGYDVTTETSSKMLLENSLYALKDSSKFKNLLTSYLQSKFGESSFSGNEEGFYSNLTGAGKFLRSTGSFLKENVFTKENISAAVGAGVGYASAKLADSANKAGDQRAIELASQQARAAEAQAAAAASALALSQQGGAKQDTTGTSGSTGTPKWVLPVAIGGGVLVIGVIVLLAMRKK